MRHIKRLGNKIFGYIKKCFQFQLRLVVRESFKHVFGQYKFLTIGSLSLYYWLGPSYPIQIVDFIRLCKHDFFVLLVCVYTFNCIIFHPSQLAETKERKLEILAYIIFFSYIKLKFFFNFNLLCFIIRYFHLISFKKFYSFPINCFCAWNKLLVR